MNQEIIEEKYLEDYPIPITLENTEIIISQMQKSICKIYMDNGAKGTGFFCRVPYPDKNHYINCLVTNNHVIDEPYLDKNKSIELSINNNKIEKIIKIDNRRVYTNKLYDTTIIEIFEEKDDIKDFLDIDFDLNGEILKNQYTNKSIYVLQYPKNEKVSVSYGIIKNIDLSNNYDILHLCSTDIGSSGSPIFNMLNNKIIGIHKGASNTKQFNKGTLLFFPLKEFLSKKEKKPLINNEENFVSLSKKEKKPLINNEENFVSLSKKEKKPLINHVDNFVSIPSITSSVINRINNEIKVSLDSKREGYQLFGLIGNKIYGVLEGPPYSLYEGGYFQFTIEYGKQYPFQSPRIAFQTKIFHPNIYGNGYVNVDELRNCWSPSFDLEKIIFVVLNLLVIPDYEGINNEAMELHSINVNEYENKVRQFTHEYANFEKVQNELKKLNFKIQLDN